MNSQYVNLGAGRLLIMAATMLTLLTGCAGLQPPAQRAGTAASRIVVTYNVDDLMARAKTVLARTLLDDLPDDITSAQREQLRQVINDDFDTADLTTAVQHNLAAQAVQEQQVQALTQAAAALDSPLAQRLLGLQAKVGDAGFAAAYNAFIQQPPDARREARLQQIRQLIDAMAIVDLQRAFHIKLLDAMLQTRNGLLPSAQRLTPAAINTRLEDNRSTLDQQLHEQLPPILLYAYRDVDDADFARYVQLQGASAMAWANRALAQAIAKALHQAGKKLPKQAASL